MKILNHSPPRTHLLAAGAIVLAVVISYINSLHAPFVFDDIPAIRENETIRRLWPLGSVLAPPSSGASVSGRPLVNLSFALNHAVGGLDVRGYHAVNLGIHAVNALLVFGIIRRTLLRPVVRARFGESISSVAFTIALLWAMHPLQTESVTFVVQRTESLVALFYLLTFYGFIRGVETAAPRSWHGLAFAACLAGMATKEVMVTAPLLVLLYDRTFVAGSFGDAWRLRRGYYIALAATWLLLGYLVTRSGGSRGAAAGFGLGVSAWTYALTQCRAIALYIKLALWPHPLVVDYGIETVGNAATVGPQILLLVLLLAATIWALVRRPVLGFLGAWFFVILAPSSSVVPLVAQTIAEHRIYLSLLAVIALAVGFAYEVAGRWSRVALAMIAIGFGVATILRNSIYSSEEALWRDTLASRPDNARALGGFSTVLLRENRLPEARAPLEKLVLLRPRDAEARYNLGTVYSHEGRVADAMASYEQALQLKPGHVMAHLNLGSALAQTGRLPEAVTEFKEVLRLQPDHAEARGNLGSALMILGQTTEALSQFAEAVRLKPEDAPLQLNYANALLQAGRLAEAQAHYEATLRLDPGNAKARERLARIREYLQPSLRSGR